MEVREIHDDDGLDDAAVVVVLGIATMLSSSLSSSSCALLLSRFQMCSGKTACNLTIVCLVCWVSSFSENVVVMVVELL